MNNSNSGHAKNVANLVKLIQAIDTLGTSYNPANSNLSVISLRALQAEATDRLAAVDAALADWKKATNDREIAFAELPQQSTRLLSVLGSFPVAPQTLNDMAALVKTMRGVKLSKADAGKAAPDTEGGSPVGNAVSRAKYSFDARLELFGRMVLLLQKEVLYDANDADFSKDGLQARLDELHALNAAANVAYSNLKAARIARNAFFYQEGEGLLATIRRAKSFVKGLKGAGSQVYKAVANIRFVRVVPAKKAK